MTQLSGDISVLLSCMLYYKHLGVKCPQIFLDSELSITHPFFSLLNLHFPDLHARPCLPITSFAYLYLLCGSFHIFLKVQLRNHCILLNQLHLSRRNPCCSTPAVLSALFFIISSVFYLVEHCLDYFTSQLGLKSPLYVGT